MKTICINCVHYRVCHFYGADVDECNHFMADIVRCKDCKYNIVEEWEDGLFLYGCEHPMGLEDVDAYYFCCHGERKEKCD